MKLAMTREEAIECIRGFMGQLTEGCQEAIMTVIPELRESKDEKIRKELLSFIESVQHSYLCATDRREKWIAYLKKQKEQLTESFDKDYLRLIHQAISCAYTDKVLDAQTCSILRTWLNNKVL